MVSKKRGSDGGFEQILKDNGFDGFDDFVQKIKEVITKVESIPQNEMTKEEREKWMRAGMPLQEAIKPMPKLRLKKPKTNSK